MHGEQQHLEGRKDLIEHMHKEGLGALVCHSATGIFVTKFAHFNRHLRGKNIFHAGFIGEGQRPGNAKPGEVCKQAMSSGQGNYLANLLLYPGRWLGERSSEGQLLSIFTDDSLSPSWCSCPGRPEFMKFLPEGTQLPPVVCSR